MRKWKKYLKRSLVLMLIISMAMSNTNMTVFAAETVTAITSEVIDLGNYSLETSESISFFTTEVVELKDGNHVKWIDRIDAPDYAIEFYDTLVEYSDNDGNNDFLILNDGFSIDNAESINYGGSYGTDTFNAIEFITLENPSDSEVAYNYKLMRAAFDAFLMDHPEVFWLSGRSLGYQVGYSYSSGKTTVTMYFLIKMHEGSGSDSFDIREEDYQSESSVISDINVRENSVNNILNSDVVQKANNPYELVKAFNDWLTKNNEYNTLVSSGYSTGSFRSHNCLSALEGNSGTNGPVCEGYAEAYKILCDRKNIPCVLVTGNAYTSKTANAEAHAWNYTMIDGEWYGVDITWNDPAVRGISGKISGYENENYMLVGSNTIHNDMKFEESHVVTNRVSTNGISFSNGPILSSDCYQNTATPEDPEMYTISWDTDGDGDIDDTTSVAYGLMPSHADGVKKADSQYTYTFTGWSPQLKSVTGDAVYTAQFNKTLNTYNIGWDTDGDGDIDDTTSVAYGLMPSHADGVKEADSQYTYAFTGWSPQLKSVTGDAVYTAQFNKTLNTYNIGWDTDGDGDIDDTTSVAYGLMPSHADGVKEADSQYTYAFTGWSPQLKPVTGDAAYTAQFDKEEIKTEPGEDIDPELPEIPEVEGVARVSGKDRYETGFKVADTYKSILGVNKFETVLVATGKNFADALPGSYLAYVKKAPILLTNGKKDNLETLAAYIDENLKIGGTVYILGGTGAVPEELEFMLTGYTVERLQGGSRYETNLEILKAADVKDGEMIVATGRTFADSLSASAVKIPILLVKDQISDMQKEYLKTLNISKFYIVGGEAAVGDKIYEELKAFADTERISGKNRQETSVLIAEKFFNKPGSAIIAYAKNFPDGLCGGALATALNAPLILTQDQKYEEAADYVATEGTASGYILGGDGVMSNETVVNIFHLSDITEIK